MQRVLQHPDIGGFDRVEVLKNPDPLTMQVAIETLFKERVSDCDDLIMCFFSGHCINDYHNQLYFATRLTCKNSKGELVKSTAVPFSFVQDILSDSRSRQQVVILDCCFSNAFANVWSAKNYGSVDLRNQIGGLGRVVLAASTSTQLSSHKGFELSTYTRYLVEGMELGTADLNRDRQISAYELHQYISRKMEQSNDMLLEPVLYAIGDSYNIQLANAPIKYSIKYSRRRAIANFHQQDEDAVSDSRSLKRYDSKIGGNWVKPSRTVTSKQTNNHKDALARVSPNNACDIKEPILSQGVSTGKNSKSLIGVGAIALLTLAGIFYGIVQRQDLQQLSLSETLAADTTYKHQVPTVFEHKNTVWSLAFSPDSQLLASSSGDQTIKLWQLNSGELLRTISRAHLDTIWSVAISPDGLILVSGSGDKTVKIWNLNTGELLRTLEGHTDTVRSISISLDGQTIVSGSGDKTAKVWDLSTGKLLRTLEGHTDAVRSVAISPNRQTIASGSADNTVKIWNLNTGKLLHTLTGHTGRIISIAISPEGETVASGSNDNTIKIWSLHTGKLLRTLSGHSDHVNSIAFRADGRMLVSGAEDRLIKLWNPQTGALLQTLSRHTEDVYAVAVSPDGKTLASGDKDGEIKLGQ
jgi:WD40 repeat protein